MSLVSIIDELPASWREDINIVLHHCRGHTLSKDDAKRLVKKVAQCIVRGDSAEASALITLGLILNAEQFVALVRKQGVLRPSRCSFRETCVGAILRHVMERCSGLVSHDVIAYFESISNLHDLAFELRKIDEQLLAALMQGGGELLRNLLSTLDWVFLQAGRDRSNVERDLVPYQLEDVAEGFSYLLYLYNKKLGIPVSEGYPNGKGIIHGHYLPLLKQAAAVKAFHKLEIYVDAFGYRLLRGENDTAWRLEAEAVEFEKSYQLGLIQTIIQGFATKAAAQSHKHLSLEFVGTEFHRMVGDQFVEERLSPFSRFVFRVPLILIDKVLNQESLFLEEEVDLGITTKYLMATPAELLSYRVHKDVTLGDLIKVQRLAIFVRWYAAAHMMAKLETNAEMVGNSFVPSFSCAELEELLSHAVGKDKSRKIVDLLMWRYDSDRVCDIQYQPLVRSLTSLWVPMNVLAGSNIVRNTLSLCRARLNADGQADPVAELLTKRLAEHTATVQSRVKYRFGGTAGDIDVIALMGNRLYAFECKNSLLPCNPHECRTSYDSVLKGAEQLSKLRSMFAGTSFRSYLSKILEWVIGEDTQLITCIVVGNRLFSGWRLDGHAVRGIHELAGFIRAGVFLSGQDEVRLWTGKKFTEDDLRRYIMEDTLHKVYFDCMEPETIVYRFGSQTVSLRKFGLNLLRLAVRLSAFRPVGSLESGWSVRSYGPPRSIADRFMANLRRGAQET